MEVAIAHDYLTQRGGAERVVLAMSRTFPNASLYTSVYEPTLTFPEFSRMDVHTTPLNRVALLRRDHRLAFPLLAPAMSRLRVHADVVLCSSSGWAHAVTTRGRKIVYCHAPARWLYQTERYVRQAGVTARSVLKLLRPGLRAWDYRVALQANRYVANSTHVAAAVREAYGLEAEVLSPPPALTPGGPERQVQGAEPGFLLCVSRLLAYKNVDNIVAALERLPEQRLIVVGTGPDAARLRELAPPNVRLLGAVHDDELRWLYSNCSALVTAAYEDFGLTPLEAASFGKPTAALRFGGFLDTLDEGVSGLFFDEPIAAAIARTLADLSGHSWSSTLLRRHAERFSEDRFAARLRSLVVQELEGA
jgi:glycosyltransferase involved in cell wall biosynthesis